jgi:hypothetical protein
MVFSLMQAFGRNQMSVRVSVFRGQVREMRELNNGTSAQEAGISLFSVSPETPKSESFICPDT